MGCCMGRSGASDSDEMENAITIGKNRPLVQERIKWKSDVPMTEGQLRSKRDEFWETAPAFEGRKEIWDALRAASALAEQGDYALSQAILDGANISLPDGTLRESYDELGNRYQVPYYCLSAPTNLVEERSSESSGAINQEGSQAALGGVIDRSSMGAVASGANAGELIALKLRLSTTGEDISVDCHSRETVHACKQRLHHAVPSAVPVASQQRWFYGGRVLMDKMRIADCRIPPNFVVQVVIQVNNTGKNIDDSVKSERQISIAAIHAVDQSAIDKINDRLAAFNNSDHSPVTPGIDQSRVKDNQGRPAITDDHSVINAVKNRSGSAGSNRSGVSGGRRSPNIPGNQSIMIKANSHTPIDTAVVSISKDDNRSAATKPHSAESITGIKTAVQIHPSSITGSSKESSALLHSVTGQNDTGNNGDTQRTGSSPNRKGDGKLQHLHGKKLKGHKSSGAAANGTSATNVVLQPRCNSLNSKRSNESPTPVETS